MALTEGERWARAELAALLEERFGPRAIGRFLVASQVRANAIRRARPALARREAGFLAAGAATWLALAELGAEPFRSRRRAGLGSWAATALMLDWHLGMVETEAGTPRNLGPADAATLLRAWLAPAVAARPAPVLCALGLLSDVADGRLARASAPTRFGRDLEGLADAVFGVAALRGVRREGGAGPLAVGAELARQGAGFAYALVVYFGRAEAPDPAVARAGRRAAPVRAAGLLCAAAGRRREADALLGAGAAASVLAVARALGSRHGR